MCQNVVESQGLSVKKQLQVIDKQENELCSYYMQQATRGTAEAESRAITPSEMITYFDGSFHNIAVNTDPNILCMIETDLQKKFTQSDTDFLIRKRIHELVKSARDTGQTKIPTIRIYDGICTRQNFHENLVKNPYRMAWYLQPISSYEDIMAESLYFTLKKVRDEILTMPVTEKSAPIILKALEYFSNRALGPVIQRIESKNLNVEMKQPSTMDNEEISQRFSDIQRTLAKTVVDVIKQDPE